MARRWWPAAIAVAWLAGCATAAHQVGKEATKGAIATLSGQPEDGKGKEEGKPARAAAAGAVEGMLPASPVARELGSGVAAGVVGKLAEPERLAEVEAVADRAGTAFARSFARELSGQIGAQGQGPFAAPLEAAGKRVASGILHGIGVWPFLLAAAIGSVVTLLAVAAVGAVGARRTSRRLEVRRQTA